MLTKNEKGMFIAFVMFVILIAFLLGYSDDVFGGLVVVLVSKMYDFMKASPPNENDEEYEEWKREQAE